jgi:hypothetical protein
MARVFVGAEPASIWDADEIAAMRSDFDARGHLLRQLVAGASQSKLNPDVRTKKVVHHHIHNSAGTWMCENARLAGETTTSREHNCNMYWAHEFNRDLSMDGPHLNAPQHGYPTMTCQKRLKEMAEEDQGLSFSCIERWLDYGHGDWCPLNLTYTTIVRDPLKRMGTTMDMDYGNSESIALQALKDGIAEMPNNRRWLSSHIPFDNLMVRSLNGPDVFRLPLGNITEEHLEKAKRRLEQFDVVLAIPTLYTDMIQLHEMIGWPTWIVTAQKVYHSQRSAPVFSVDFLDFLTGLNKHDIELYNFGVELARQRTEKHLAQFKIQQALVGQH